MKIRLSHTQVIALGFLIVITVGTLFLMLPFASKTNTPTSFLDSLFTAVSATCVTGLVVKDTFIHWSYFGKTVILFLIQIGGLGFITISTMFFLILRKKIGLKDREILSESINSTHVGGVVRLAKLIITGTFSIELIGAFLLSLRFCPSYGLWQGIYMGIFHSVSAFCNAGFDLLGGSSPFCSLTGFYDDAYINIIIMSLIIVGGIGFIVWDDVYTYKFKLKKYRFHSKLVLLATAILIFVPAIFFFILEQNFSMESMTLKGKILSSLFSSVTARTAGFNTTDTAIYSHSSKILTVILMFIGGSPGSTAGGIKTTTMLVILFFSFSYMRKNRDTSIMGRRIGTESLVKATAVFFTNLTLIILATLIMCTIEPFPPIDILFETASAVGTVGITVGITRALTVTSKIIIITLMFCGRVGAVSFAMALAEKKDKANIKNPVGELIIG